MVEHRQGNWRSPTYHSWRCAKERCHRPGNDNYKWYGALGVVMCARWRERGTGFLNFLEDMGVRPEGMTLDRVDPLGNYEPGNCRWATAEEQARNKRRNVVPA